MASEHVVQVQKVELQFSQLLQVGNVWNETDLIPWTYGKYMGSFALQIERLQELDVESFHC